MRDSHIHTKYSDGELDEFEIIEEVFKSGVTEFTICDHDTIIGSQKVFDVLKANNPHNLKFHSGVELSCRIPDMFGGINVHILYRDFEYSNQKLKRFLDEISIKRAKKVDLMVQFVKETFGVEIPKQEIEELKTHTTIIGKPHIYQLLIKHKPMDCEVYYKAMKRLPSQNLKLDLYELLKELKDDVGYFTLAHPIEIMEEYGLSYEDVENIVAHFAPLGIKALETKHYKISKEESQIFHQIAEKYGLLETEGSDFHGPHVKPNLHIGDIQKPN
ncbi:MAG: PHP domain-containing protein [Clostridia bacterium]|nr:PHP domain-containing protein [Clostridia bacterium]